MIDKFSDATNSEISKNELKELVEPVDGNYLINKIIDKLDSLLEINREYTTHEKIYKYF